jgi:flavodoxin I
MKPILLLYSTNSGSTFTVGQIIQEILSEKFAVEMQNAVEFKPEDIKKYDTVILGSPSWLSRGEEGMPTETMLKLLDVWKGQKFSNKKFAVYGCGDDGFATFCGAVGHLEDFIKSVGGTFLIPSLRLNSFWFDIDKNVELAKKWAKELKTKLAV